MGNTGFLKKSSRILSLKCRQAYAFSFKNTWAKEKPKTLLFLDNIQNTDQVGSGLMSCLAPGCSVKPGLYWEPQHHRVPLLPFPRLRAHKGIKQNFWRLGWCGPTKEPVLCLNHLGSRWNQHCVKNRASPTVKETFTMPKRNEQFGVPVHCQVI